MMSTIIYGSLALLLGSHTKSPDIILHLFRSGRDCGVFGIEEMVAPAMSRHPLRIRCGQDQTTKKFLQTIQDDISHMVEFQFTSWKAIRRLSKEIDESLRAACLVNVVYEECIGHIEGGLGLEFISNRDVTIPPVAFWVRCVISTDKIKVTTNYDPRVFQEQGIRRLLCQFEAVCLDMMNEDTQGQIHSTQIRHHFPSGLLSV
jgi:hypothetical protein